MSRIIELCSQVVDAMTTAGLSSKIAAIPWYMLEEVQELTIEVIPWSEEQAKKTRNWQAEIDHGCLIIVQSHLEYTDIPGLDLLLDIIEQIQVAVKGATYNEGCISLVAITRDNQYDFEALTTANQFIGNLVLLFKEVS